MVNGSFLPRGEVININHRPFSFTVTAFHSYFLKWRHFYTASCYTKEQENHTRQDNETVCVIGTHLYTQSKVYHSKSIKDHTTISSKDQISQDAREAKPIQSKRYMTRNVKYIEKEAKPIPFIEDW